MPATFTVTLPPTIAEAHDNGDGAPLKREIWLRSTSPVVVGQISDITLDKVHDNYPNGEDPLASSLSFVIAIGKETAQAPKNAREGVLFPTSSIRVDSETVRPFLWAGTGAKAVEGSAYSIEFTEDSEVASSISAGDYLYLRIIVGVEADPGSSDLELCPGIERATPLILGRIVRSSPSSGVSSGLVGARRNVIPKGTANKNSMSRQVWIGRHPILGSISRFFNMFGVIPDTHKHWAVFVGQYYHELCADGNWKIFYQNGNVDDEVFEMERVGTTKFNDQAIVEASGRAIRGMKPDYELLENNCQKFCISVLTQICLYGRKKLDTSYAVQISMPEFEFNKLAIVDRPAHIVVEKPLVTKVSTELYYQPSPPGSCFIDEDVPLTEEERKILLDRAAEIMGGTA